MSTRNVPFTEDTVLRYLEREWFPRTIDEISHDFKVSDVDALIILSRLVRGRSLVMFMHPVRNCFVYTVPSNPNIPK